MKSFKLLSILILISNVSYSIQMDIGIIRNARIKHVLFETNFGKHTIVSGEFVKSIEQGEQIKIQYHNDSVRLKIGERSLAL